MRYHCTQVKWLLSKNKNQLKITNAGKNVGKKELTLLGW
jgi:hypothetical protein